MYSLAVLVLALSVFLGSAIAQAAEQKPAHKDDMGEMARKLSDPTSDIWALQLECFWYQLSLNQSDEDPQGVEKVGLY